MLDQSTCHRQEIGLLGRRLSATPFPLAGLEVRRSV
jgi:hypothetical protein